MTSVRWSDIRCTSVGILSGHLFRRRYQVRIQGSKQTGQIVDYQVKTKLSSGEEVDCVQLVNDLFYTRDRDKQVEIVKKLAEATNSLVPIMPIGEKTAPFKVYNEKLTYPEDPIAPEWYGGANDRVWLRQIKHGLMYFAD